MASYNLLLILLKRCQLSTYEILYKTLQVIEKIIGFAADSNGVEIVTHILGY